MTQTTLDSGLDLIDRLAALEPDSSLAGLRRERETVRSSSQGSHEALFDSLAAAPELGLAERALAAWRVATLAGDAVVSAQYHRHALSQGLAPEILEAWADRPSLSDPKHTPQGNQERLIAFVDRLAEHPEQAEPRHIDQLLRPGFGPAALVTLAQVVAYVSYQLRVVAGLRALAGATAVQTDRTASSPPSASSADLVAGHHPLQPAALRRGRFTRQVLEWRSWLPTVDPQHASSDQISVLDESHAQARTSPYYLTLLHNPAVLRQRSRLFNAIMYGPGGLPRAERELTTVAVSRLNGCPYCASVHARLFAQLSKEPAVIDAIYADGVNTPLSPRRRALVDLAADLSQAQPALAPGRIDQLRDAGLSDLEILDGIHAAAIFAWANRLMQTLGEPVETGRD